jgi:hypothetical protein
MKRLTGMAKMADERRSAATALYPHLKSQERPTQQASNVSAPHAMYPKLAPPPPPDPYSLYMRKLGFIRTDQQPGRR